MRKILLSGLMLAACYTATAAPVQIKMNSYSETMSLATHDGTSVDVGEPQDRTYTLDLVPGNYILTGYGSDKLVNGSISLTVEDKTEIQEFSVLTLQIYATNKDAEGNPWIYGKDYSVNAKVMTREGNTFDTTIGENSDSNRKCLLAYNGNSVYAEFIPSNTKAAEGYLSLSRSGTVTFNTSISGEIPMGADFIVTLPASAGLEIGQKGSHFTEFSVNEPERTELNGDTKNVFYRLAGGQKFNIRTWKDGGITQALYFNKSTETETMEFTETDYAAYNPKQVNHDPTSNQGYETGDIFVNINERGHLAMTVGDTFDAHAMRTWQLTDTQIDNYFFEPDFHYTVIDLDGNPSSGVIEISTDDTTSPWRTIKAVGNGTAIVLVTYDAISVTRNGKTTPYMGGQYWGAIWPENTAVYVVTVGENASDIQHNMVVNEKYNTGEDGKALLKLAGKYVDAEHDVFYYLDSEPGYNFSFTPEGVASVTLAYPIIGENAATYKGFASEGVTANADGSYTLLLKHGRNIVKLTDASGKSVYQVIKAKSCHREITNETRGGSDEFYPGDKVKIQYSGLFHPANKLAGIYNMSAYVTYNGKPNGTSLILGAGQYTFGSAPKAQAVELEIPEDYDALSAPEYVLNDGVIQVNGYGDPIGNHRNISKTAGRSPNFTAMAHKTYFGAIPELTLPITPRKHFTIKLNCDIENAYIVLKKGENVKNPVEGQTYDLVTGEYSIYASADNYRCFRYKFELTEESEEVLEIPVNLEYAPEAWNGADKTEPAIVNGVYQISNGAELAWMVELAENRADNQNAELIADIDLGYYEWKAIGRSFSRAYTGIFNGNGHKIYNLYSYEYQNYAALFGCVGKDGILAEIKNLAVYGEINNESNRCAGIASCLMNAVVSNCASHVNVSAPKGHAGGIATQYGVATITNCYNTGNITASNNAAGIIPDNSEGLIIKNVFNIGIINAQGTFAPCAFSPSDPAGDLSNMFCIEDEDHAWFNGEKGIDGSEIVSAERMASGEIAWRLGEAFGQTIGKDEYPVLDGDKVFKVDYVTIANGNASESETLYTNATLPETINGETANWYTDTELTQSVTTVEADATLYLTLGTNTGVDNVCLLYTSPSPRDS